MGFIESSPQSYPFELARESHRIPSKRATNPRLFVRDARAMFSNQLLVIIEHAPRDDAPVILCRFMFSALIHLCSTRRIAQQGDHRARDRLLVTRGNEQ